jgi:hypothetical protein
VLAVDLDTSAKQRLTGIIDLLGGVLPPPQRGITSRRTHSA